MASPLWLDWLKKMVLPRAGRRPARRRVARKRVQTCRPRIESLEDRTAPAISLSYLGTGNSLSLSETTAAVDNVTISEQTPNTLLRIDLNGATFAAGSTVAATGLTYQNPGSPTTSTFATVYISTLNAITTLSANLGSMDDALSFSLPSNANMGVRGASLDGGTGTDTIALGSITLFGSFSVFGSDATTIAGGSTISNSGGVNRFYQGPVTLTGTGSVSLDANSGGIVFGSTVAAGAVNLSMEGFDVDFSNTVSGTGSIRFTPGYDANIRVGGATDAGAGIDITDAELAKLSNGFSQVIFGTPTGAFTISVDSSSFVDPVLFQTPSGGSITVNGTISGSDNASVTLDGSGATTTLNADVVTAGQPILISDSVILGTPSTVTLDTTNGGASAAGANITVTGTVNDDTANTTGLVLRAGTAGDIALQAAVGGTALSTFSVVSADEVTLSGQVTTVGNVGVTAGRSIVVTGGISTTGGAVTLQANQGATPTTGNFVGIDINGATITSTTGAVLLQGKGGDTSGGNYGVEIQGGGKVQTTGSGTVTVQGTGGAGSANANFGVFVTGTGSQVTSGGGSVSVTGQGGGSGSSGSNIGVQVFSGGVVTAGGSGAVAVQGTGGAGSGDINYGVVVNGAGAQVTSGGGSVSITGQGGGSSSSGFNLGVLVLTGGVVTAGGTGAVTVQGTGGAASGSNNYGVEVAGTGAQVTSGGGSVSVTGQGGGSGASSSNYGVHVNIGGVVAAGGSGAVTVQGTGGVGTAASTTASSSPVPALR